jgi:hypothetical protein
MNEEDSDYTNVASFDAQSGQTQGQSGIAKLPVFYRGDDIKFRFRCNGFVEIYDVEIKGSATRGF